MIELRLGTILSEEFSVVNGFKQCETLFPLLFNLVLEYVVLASVRTAY